jgi:type III pantothenate kinase
VSKRITVGVGNTSVQFAQFPAPLPANMPVPDWHLSVPADTDFNALKLPAEPPPASRWVVASVNHDAESQIKTWVESKWQPQAYCLLGREDFPVKVELDHPDRVGHDRLAGAVAVNSVRESGQSAIFVDAGTAITVNAINARGVFVGGAILPGTLIASRALATWTDQLPEVSVDWRLERSSPAAIGGSTESALESGIYWSAVGAVRELIRRIAGELGSEPATYITGGFGEHLAKHLDGAVYIPHLVVAGIVISSQGV